MRNKEIINKFESFHGFLDICFYFDKTEEINKLNLLEILDDEKDMLRLEMYDKFICENTEKFVNEFNIRLNKFNIYELYIEL